jgi:predicted negative regulator of RcsB-dependent stress response
MKNAPPAGHSAVRPESVQIRDYGDDPLPPPDKPAERARAAPQPAPEKRARKRRVVSERDRLTLWALGLASLVALGSAAVLLGLIPGPFGQAPAGAPTPEAPASAAPTPSPASPPSKPAAAIVANPQPVEPAAAAPAKAAPEPAPQLAQPSAQSAAQAPAAPTAETAQPETARPQATKPEASKLEASKPGAAATAAGQPASAAEDEAGGSGQAALAAARKKLAEDDPQGAETLVRQVLAKDPQDHHAMELLAHALMDQDRGAEALPYARKIVQRRPRRVAYRLLLGDLLLMVGEGSSARAEWLEASKIAPDDPQIKRRLSQ